MKIHRPGWRGALVSASAVAVAAGATFGALTVAGVTFQGEGEAQEGLGRRLTGDGLITANRDHLAICVDAVAIPGKGVISSAEVGLAKVTVEEALDRLAEEPAWIAPGPGLDRLFGVPTVDVTCPANPYAFEPGVEFVVSGSRATTSPVRFVEEASAYRLFVFVVPDDEVSARFTNAIPVIYEEFLRLSADEGVGVTRGLYVTVSQSTDPTFFTNALASVLGIDLQDGREWPDWSSREGAE